MGRPFIDRSRLLQPRYWRAILRHEKDRLTKYIRRGLRKARNSLGFRMVAIWIQLLDIRRGDGPAFVKVGANDGSSRDPIWQSFLASKKWHGLFVEADPGIAEQLKNALLTRRNAVVCNVAVDAADGLVDFFSVRVPESEADYSGPEWWSHLGSLDKAQVEKHNDGVLKEYIKRIRVEAVTLENLLHSEGLPRVDLLQTDTEGSDYKVLSSVGSFPNPPVLVFETINLPASELSALNQLLTARGYRFVLAGYMDAVAITSRRLSTFLLFLSLLHPFSSWVLTVFQRIRNG